MPALVDAGRRTTVKVSASGYDTRTSDPGCSPKGCIPKNTRDHNLSSTSRWSCKGDILDNDKGCWIKYSFKEPQDIKEIEIAFYKGDEGTRTLKVYSNGRFHTKIKSSGKTNDFQTFDLDTDETSELKLYLNDYKSNSDVWLSLTEVCGISAGM
ncbi:MAG: hypothetical protein ABJI00_06075 [Paracoccaceae bacterium]